MALYTNRATIADAVLALPAARDSLSIHEAAAAGVVARLETILAADPDAANAWSPDGFQPLGLAAFFGRAKRRSTCCWRAAARSTPSRATSSASTRCMPPWPARGPISRAAWSTPAPTSMPPSAAAPRRCTKRPFNG